MKENNCLSQTFPRQVYSATPFREGAAYFNILSIGGAPLGIGGAALSIGGAVGIIDLDVWSKRHAGFIQAQQEISIR